MIDTPEQYQKAQDELRRLQSWLDRLQKEHPVPGKGLTKAGVRKMMARLHEELAVYEGGQEVNHSETPLSHSGRAKGGTYVTDITHYLDETGEMARLPAPARKLASFLTLLIEAATSASSANYHDSSIRCRRKACGGTILTMLPPSQDEISWHCTECGHNGVIRNWQNTKWNQLKRAAQPE
jgi:hypothetical protein